MFSGRSDTDKSMFHAALRIIALKTLKEGSGASHCSSHYKGKGANGMSQNKNYVGSNHKQPVKIEIGVT